MIVVNPSTRQFNIPGADLVFGVTADSGAVTKEFQCPRYVGNNLDLAGCFIRMNYRNANGEIDSYLVKNVAVDGDNIVFGWELSPKVTMYKGNVSFVMCVTGPDTKVAWHTTQGRGQVLEGLEPDWEPVMDETVDVVAQLIAMVEAQTVAVENKGAEWVRNVQSEGTDQIIAVQTAGKEAETAAVAEIEAKGVNVRESIPDDYTSLGNAVDGLVRGRAGAIVCSVEGSTVAVNDASDLPIQGMKIFGRSTQDGTPTPDAPVEIKSVVNPTISVNEQTLTISKTLPGIPVTSGGNYTDSNGQQWICDEVDLERGVYVKRIGSVILDGSADEEWEATSAQYHISLLDKRNNRVQVNNALWCSHFKVPITIDNSQGFVTETYWQSGNRNVLFNYDNGVGGLDNFKVWLQSNPVTLQYMLNTPIETPLSETEIAAYRALHSNYPNTTVLNDSGAHMVVKYAADTKLYIDNKIAALIGG